VIAKNLLAELSRTGPDRHLITAMANMFKDLNVDKVEQLLSSGRTVKQSIKTGNRGNVEARTIISITEHYPGFAEHSGT
jgi:hypothetical protein